MIIAEHDTQKQCKLIAFTVCMYHHVYQYKVMYSCGNQRESPVLLSPQEPQKEAGSVRLVRNYFQVLY